MSASSQRRSEEFLKVSSQFKLGALVTEASHLVTVNLSVEAKLVMNALSTCTMVRLGRVGQLHGLGRAVEPEAD